MYIVDEGVVIVIEVVGSEVGIKMVFLKWVLVFLL